MINQRKIEELLSQVKKPGRYLGNEWNSVKKDLNRSGEILMPKELLLDQKLQCSQETESAS